MGGPSVVTFGFSWRGDRATADDGYVATPELSPCEAQEFKAQKKAVLTSKSSPNRFGKRWIMTHDFTTKTWNGNPMKLSLSIVPNDQLDCIRLDRCVP